MKTLFAIGLLIAAFIINAAFMHVGGWHIVYPPTPEQLYGCKFAVADAHNGECP
jgi:hypothetical protein